MQIVCPNCEATYQVSATAIGTVGRQVRCVRCRTVWHQKPMAEVPPITVSPHVAGMAGDDDPVEAFKAELGAAEPPPPAPALAEPVAASAQPAESPAPAALLQEEAPTQNGDPSGPPLSDLMAQDETAPPQQADAEPAAAASLSDITIPVEPSPPVAPELPEAGGETGRPADAVEAAARRRRRSTARRRLPVRPGAASVLIVVFACIIGALFWGRATVVRHAPQMASLYATIGLPVNLRGLEFSGVEVSRETHDGVTVLVVAGTITNTVSQSVEVPRLRFAMRNETGSEIYAWTAMPSKEALSPGETLEFRSRLASPPGEGRDVTVRFFTRLDAVAGLR